MKHLLLILSFLLLIPPLFDSLNMLHSREMTVLDSEVLETQQMFEELVLQAIRKGNLSSNKVVGILNAEIEGNVSDPRYIPVMDNALGMILAAHTSLAERSLLENIDKEQKLMLKRGEASFAGASIGVLAELDYFAWASFSPIGRRNTNVRVTLADAKTGVVRSMSSKTLKLPIELMLSEHTNTEEFHGWKEQWEDSSELIEFSRNTFWIGAGLLTAGVIAAPCEEKNYKDDRKYDNFIECNRQEAGRLYSTTMFVGFLSFAVGGITMLVEESNLTRLEQKRKSNKFPAISLWRHNGRTDVQLVYHF